MQGSGGRLHSLLIIMFGALVCVYVAPSSLMSRHNFEVTQLRDLRYNGVIHMVTAAKVKRGKKELALLDCLLACCLPQ